MFKNKLYRNYIRVHGHEPNEAQIAEYRRMINCKRTNIRSIARRNGHSKEVVDYVFNLINNSTQEELEALEFTKGFFKNLMDSM